MSSLKNKKGHFDPICLAFPIVSTVLGIVFMMTVKRPARMSGFEHYLLFGFVLAVLISMVVRTMKHGLAGMSAIIGFALVVVCMMMFRFAIGTPTPSEEFFVKYVKVFVPIMIGGSWLQQFMP